MKLTKKQNPFDVRAGQVWKPKEKSRGKGLFIVRIEEALNGFMAVAEHSRLGHVTRHTMISLLNFGRYTRIK